MSDSDGSPDPDVPRDTGYDEWAAALGDGGYYLECPNGHGSLPPRRVCPECGETDLSEESLPATGEVATYSEVHVAPSGFGVETPYVTAIVDFGPVRLTGLVRGADGETAEDEEAVGDGEVTDDDEIAVGDEVRPDVEENEATGNPLVVFRPA